MSGESLVIAVVLGSILDAKAQVIVNAANSRGVIGQVGGFVSQAVHGRLGLW